MRLIGKTSSVFNLSLLCITRVSIVQLMRREGKGNLLNPFFSSLFSKSKNSTNIPRYLDVTSPLDGS